MYADILGGVFPWFNFAHIASYRVGFFFFTGEYFNL